MYLKQFFVEGLGHSSYLIASDETREAAVIDPRRDVAVYLEEAAREDISIRYVLETHCHNDFVSGAKQLAECSAATHVASAEAGLRFAYQAVREGDQFSLGELRIAVLFTPGHTPEHVCYVATDTSRAAVPVLVFTGGDLLVGYVGRPDLLGPQLAEKLAPLLYDSLHHKLLTLEDYVEVLPTHGGGSYCGRGISNKRTSTIGYERRFNPALRLASKHEFVNLVLSGNPGIPAYYRRMRPKNQQGPNAWRLPELPALLPEDLRHAAGHGAIIVDTRSSGAFGAGHIAGAINMWLGPNFATWVGWLLPDEVPLALVLENHGEWAEVVTRLARVGYERFAGYLQFGMSAWNEAGLPVAQQPQWSVDELRERLDSPALRVLDVRSDSEWQAGHMQGAAHISLDQLIARISELDRNKTIAAICGSGHRSSTAGSLLRQQGFEDVVDVTGGMKAWKALGYPTVLDDASHGVCRVADS